MGILTKNIMIKIEDLEYSGELDEFSIRNTKIIIYSVLNKEGIINFFEVIDLSTGSMLSPTINWIDSNSLETKNAHFNTLQDALDAYNKILSLYE